jgi:hypothetical protein
MTPRSQSPQVTIPPSGDLPDARSPEPPLGVERATSQTNRRRPENHLRATA